MEDIQIQRIEVITVKPGDTILVYLKKSKMPTGILSIERIRDRIKALFPQCGPIVFVDDEMKIEFAREEG